MLDACEPACQPVESEEPEAVVGKVQVERCDERVGLGFIEVADQAAQPNIGPPHDESRRLGAEPVRAARFETGPARKPGRDRPVLLLCEAATAAGSRDQAIFFDAGR